MIGNQYLESAEKISVTGPDGAGKDTAWRIAGTHLKIDDLRILKIGKPSSVFLNGRETYVDSRLSKMLDWVHEWADYKRSRLMTSVANAAYVMFQWRIQEPLWSFRIHPDVIFSLRDGYIDPAAYAPYYMPDTLGKLCIPDRISALHRLHGSPLRDHTIMLDIKPAIAVERIARRIEMQNQLESVSAVLRPKWQHQHENEVDLTAIRAEFFNVLHYLDGIGTGVDIVDASQSKEDVGSNLASKLQPLFHR